MSAFFFNHDHLILDACCAINLYASFQMESILSSIPVPVVVSDYVKDEEALNILGGADEDGAGRKDPVDLQPLIDLGLIKVVSLEVETESEAYINFAAELDDDEAITAAIALHRNWAVGTDDRKATNLFQRDAPKIQIISTPELIKYWADTNNPSWEMVTRALRNIRMRARYFPQSNHPLYYWWIKTENPKSDS